MIVRRAQDSVQLITQPDHAHLARRIMEHGVALERRPRQFAILHAIAEHDNGWEEPDAAPTVDPQTGTAVDFVRAPVSVRQGVWPRAISRLANDPWAAALVAHHAVTVYERFRTDPAWTSFFAEMEGARDTHVQASGLSFDHLVADYPFLRLADLISLTFCTGSIGDVQFGTWTIRLVDSSVIVRPDVFGGATVPFEVRAREIPNQAFRFDGELRMACETANTIMLRGDVR
jgi:hypothetical protein